MDASCHSERLSEVPTISPFLPCPPPVLGKAPVAVLVPPRHMPTAWATRTPPQGAGCGLVWGARPSAEQLAAIGAAADYLI